MDVFSYRGKFTKSVICSETCLFLQSPLFLDTNFCLFLIFWLYFIFPGLFLLFSLFLQLIKTCPFFEALELLEVSAEQHLKQKETLCSNFGQTMDIVTETYWAPTLTECAQPAYGPQSFLKKSPVEKNSSLEVVLIDEESLLNAKKLHVLTNISVKLFCKALLSFISSILIVPLSNLPHVCIHRYSIWLIQTHQADTVCHLQDDKKPWITTCHSTH